MQPVQYIISATIGVYTVEECSDSGGLRVSRYTRRVYIETRVRVYIIHRSLHTNIIFIRIYTHHAYTMYTYSNYGVTLFDYLRRQHIQILQHTKAERLIVSKAHSLHIVNVNAQHCW